jgi:nitrogen permease regulator 3-like protein
MPTSNPTVNNNNNNNNNLLAILLITQSHAHGRKLTFHYPANPDLPPSASTFPTNTTAAKASWYGGAIASKQLAREAELNKLNEIGRDGLGGRGYKAEGDSDNDSYAAGGADEDEDEEDAENEGEGDGEGSVSRSGKGSGRTRTIGGSGRTLGAGPGGSGVTGGIWGREGVEEDDDEDDELRAQQGDVGKVRSTNGRGNAKGRQYEPAWEKLLGYRSDALEKLLSPNRAYDKKKFELGIEGLVFVGAPVFVREDGAWKRKRKWEAKERTVSDRSKSKVGEAEDENEEAITDDEEENGTSEQIEKQDPISYPPGWEPGYGHGLMSGAASNAPSDAGSDAKSQSTNGPDSDMSMFNVVFVMSPPALEHFDRVKEIYDNVARRYAKALKYQQARYGLVWDEAKKILSMKQKAREKRQPVSTLWANIISSSMLAKSMAVIFSEISAGKIANIHLANNFEIPFRIPQIYSTSTIASATKPQEPGLWLTTANVFADEEAEAAYARHAALLFLEDRETIIKEIESERKGYSALMAFYIKKLTPEKSLHKLSVIHSIPEHDIQYIAGHYVYWRRARLIPPLHPRDTYIVSPNCDLASLQSASQAYAARFPALPSLPRMLSLLSTTPKPYGSFIPTHDHRSAYMDILAWLMRGGWVTQLRTFAWVQVTTEIKAKVAATMQKEAEREKEANLENGEHELSADVSRLSLGERLSGLAQPSPTRSNNQMDNSLSPLVNNAFLSPTRPTPDSSSSNLSRSPFHSLTASPNVLKPTKRLSPLHVNESASPTSPRNNMTSPLSPTSSTTDSGNRHLSPSSQHPLSPISSTTSPTAAKPSDSSNHTSTEQGQREHETHHEPSLIPSPTRANALEARWLEAIRDTFHDAELKDAWPTLLKYFDGRQALDDIAVREGWKRKKVHSLIGLLNQRGWLVSVRHW